MKKMFNEGNQIHNFISSSGSGTIINYGSGSGSGSVNISLQRQTLDPDPEKMNTDPQHCRSGIRCLFDPLTRIRDPE
jgi:hypothetical protein